MGILSTTASICQFQVTGSRPETDLFEWASERLIKFRFQPIDNSLEETSTGWVHLDDYNKTDFLTPADFFREHYIAMTLRKDQRRIPSVLLKAEMAKVEAEFLEANPNFKRVPKDQRDDMFDAVRKKLAAKTLPSPSTYDVVWDTDADIITLTGLSDKLIDLFMEVFRETFQGLNLSIIHPYMRGEMVCDKEHKQKLEKANETSKEDSLSLISANLWIGSDFLLWLLYKTMNDTSEYKVRVEGPLEKGESFIAYIQNRVVLTGAVGGDDDGIQKITAAGPQKGFNEVLTALKKKKQITEGGIRFDKGEESWRMILKSNFFHFASFKTPSVKIEKDDLADNSTEKEAVFYEKMLLMEKGLQLFDSLFFQFLTERLGDGWKDLEKGKKKWLEKG